MDAERLEGLLGLNSSRVAAAAQAAEEYANLLWAGELEPLELDATAGPEQADVDDHALRVAGAFTTAASLWMLLDARRAAPLLVIAAREHGHARTGYDEVLRLVAHPRHGLLDPPFATDAQQPRPPEVTILSVLAPLARGELPPVQLEAVLSNLPEVTTRPRGTPAGKLRLPLGLYLDMLFEVGAIRSERFDPGPDFRAEATERYLARVAEATSLARADLYHWNMPGTRFLPVEPETVAPCALVDLALREVLGASLVDGAEYMRDRYAVGVALVADEMVGADGFGEPEPPAATA